MDRILPGRYGDISPYTEGEMFGSILVMLVGAIIMSGYFQSQITSFCLQLDGARLDLFHRLDGVKIALVQIDFSYFHFFHFHIKEGVVND